MTEFKVKIMFNENVKEFGIVESFFHNGNDQKIQLLGMMMLQACKEVCRK